MFQLSGVHCKPLKPQPEGHVAAVPRASGGDPLSWCAFLAWARSYMGVSENRGVPYLGLLILILRILLFRILYIRAPIFGMGVSENRGR